MRLPELGERAQGGRERRREEGEHLQQTPRTPLSWKNGFQEADEEMIYQEAGLTLARVLLSTIFPYS